ncbi:hypothetical protein ATERTT37_006404 [Aspergillus terreus]
MRLGTKKIQIGVPQDKIFVERLKHKRGETCQFPVDDRHDFVVNCWALRSNENISRLKIIVAEDNGFLQSEHVFFRHGYGGYVVKFCLKFESSIICTGDSDLLEPILGCDEITHQVRYIREKPQLWPTKWNGRLRDGMTSRFDKLTRLFIEEIDAVEFFDG